MKETVIWKAASVLIPGVGMAETGKPISMDSNMAASFKAQGKAEDLPKTKQKEEE